MPDEKATRARSYTVTMSEKLSKEIRSTAANMGLPASKVRAIVSTPALESLAKSEGNVRLMVGAYFAKIAGKV